MRLLLGTLAIAVSGMASAVTVPLGTQLGAPLPIVGSGLLVVAASGLVIAIRIARKKKRKL